MRARIAPVIISVGTIGIASLAIAVMLFLYQASQGAGRIDGIAQKLDTILLSVFTSVLSVFATWVGTILAFYFTNESFRAASASAQRLLGAPTAEEPITDRMVAIQKMTVHQLPEGANVNSTPLDELRKKFNRTVTRLPVLNHQGHVLLIVRSKLLEAFDKAQAGANAVQNPTIAHYLAQDQNREDALNFVFLPAAATLEDARRLLRAAKTNDIFITDSGRPQDPIRGWVTDDVLKQ